ncbi:anthranilate synthase component I [Sporolactobacillus sp. KGMB 08714]|uniref:anthranilate synthase component I n=1 Tax=Sporolactobacillus sp. KGMB 08714 TaxID=3064704 RepID=UPI002FBE851F
MSLSSDANAARGAAFYTTDEGLRITRSRLSCPADKSVSSLLSRLDDHKGAFFSSTYKFPGRYSRWDIGFINPPLELTAKGNAFHIRALNERGKVILAYLNECLAHPSLAFAKNSDTELSGTIRTDSDDRIKEEDRTRRSSVFTLLRQFRRLFQIDDGFLGLYGAFGFDLIYQFEHLPMYKKREAKQNDLQLYLPDELFVADREKKEAYKLSYEFSYKKRTTDGLARSGRRFSFDSDGDNRAPAAFADRSGDYAEMVRQAKTAFKKGDLFEVVPSRVLSRPCKSRPSAVFRRLQEINPSPYGFLIHLNEEEFLVGCSPEMYVRVDGATVETCPISGTIRRRGSVIEDAEQIKTLLGSEKEESELTMCTDVDRNDKSRICVPGTVKVIGRRQVETYSHLFHTVDHIKGLLKKDFDALDAFITHMWAVTVTGAPKLEAMNWIEKHEKTPRGWYGGAVGWFRFNGSLNTGLMLRSLHIQKGTAQIRVGATLLYDSVPENEEEETLTKAEALMEALETDSLPENLNREQPDSRKPGKHLHILFVDHEDSFVHTLSGYFQKLGAEVTVRRSPAARRQIKDGSEPADLVVLSPGPGEPDRFQMNETIRLCLERRLPIFGICLGLQGIVRYFGGELKELDVPAHGKSSFVIHDGRSSLFQGVPRRFKAGRYHSICAGRLPSELHAIAETEDHVIMAVEHRSLPISAVQFHPESIMTMGGEIGMKILKNVLRSIAMQPAGK